MSKLFSSLLVSTALILVPALSLPHPAFAEVKRIRIEHAGQLLRLEILSDRLLHFEWSPVRAGVDQTAESSIYTTPMVVNKDYSGPAHFSASDHAFETRDLKVSLDSSSLCLSVSAQGKPKHLARLCPQSFRHTIKTAATAPANTPDGRRDHFLHQLRLNENTKGITLVSEETRNLYGLGEQFLPHRLGTADGDWMGETRTAGSPYGNAMTPFNKGFTGNAQFPILYALGEQNQAFALFLDQPYWQSWDFKSSPWKIETAASEVRGYFIAGDGVEELRKSYMGLVGRPLVPPKKAFGMWVSEYGYRNWGEVREKLAGLRKHAFPVDGFVLDLFWFGGVVQASDHSRMGALDWDLSQFPEPEKEIAQLREGEGLGLITIEEPYISKGLPEHHDLESRGFLARKSERENTASYLSENPWWGKGGMLDWSNPEAADYWHDLKRQKLIDAGVMGHWTDLGEPEQYSLQPSWYHGFPEIQKSRHADVHNLYNFLWHESIYRGYLRNHVQQRPFLLGRSGAPGSQRFGAAMWSGDIGSNLRSLASHLNAQMHLSMSGIDYFGSDVGGFHRTGLEGDLNETYTRWFAHSAAFDVPLRPHTDNQKKKHETSPDKVGDLKSNLSNLRQRYELIPYYYSLAHLAHLEGEPVFPPLFYYYPNDPALRQMGNEKLIGRDLLVATGTRLGEQSRDVYLPAGAWVDVYDHRWHHSQGEWLRGVPEHRDGLFKLPTYARAGAIIPKMTVDEQSMNSLGRRMDGSVRSDLILDVYAAERASEFVLFEDDGQTGAYQQGALARTRISQHRQGGRIQVTVDPVSGSYGGAIERRSTLLNLFLEESQGLKDLKTLDVKLNGMALKKVASFDALAEVESGWALTEGGALAVKSPGLHVAERKSFEVTLSP